MWCGCHYSRLQGNLLIQLRQNNLAAQVHCFHIVHAYWSSLGVSPGIGRFLILVGGLMAAGRVRSPNASASHEGHMAKFHPLIHSSSSDKRWAIRAVAARLDRLWVVSELLQTDFPPGEPSTARLKGPRRPLALADDNWGPWTNVGLADGQLETMLRTSQPGEPSAPSGLNAQVDA